MIFDRSTKGRQPVDKGRQDASTTIGSGTRIGRAPSSHEREKRPPSDEAQRQGEANESTVVGVRSERCCSESATVCQDAPSAPTHPSLFCHATLPRCVNSGCGRLKRPRRSDSARWFACSLPGQIPVASAPTLSRPVLTSLSVPLPLARRRSRSPRVAHPGDRAAGVASQTIARGACIGATCDRTNPSPEARASSALRDALILARECY